MQGRLRTENERGNTIISTFGQKNNKGQKYAQVTGHENGSGDDGELRTDGNL
jgi:hypothetical protein